MNRMALTIAVSVASCVSTQSCVMESTPSDLMVIETGNEQLLKTLATELTENGIYYETLDASRLAVKEANAVEAGNVFNAVMQEALPRDRTIAPNPGFYDQLVGMLKERDITCDPISAIGENWLVCDHEDMETVRSLTQQLTIELFDQN